MLVRNQQAPIAATKHIPQHVAIIPDGNRRWAAQRQYGLLEAYTIAAKAIDRTIDDLVARGIRNITVWPTSTRTWWRTDSDIRALTAAIQRHADTAQISYPSRGYRYRTIGRLDRLNKIAPELVRQLTALEEATAKLTTANVTMAFDYDGGEEIARALRRIVDKQIPSDAISPELISRHLDTADLPDPDLIIRTGGDHRLSGFMPVQARYAEICFVDTLLPDIDQSVIDAALERFASRRYSQ